jgi:hypothetical protein
MAGLLDNNYRPDPLAQGLLGFGTALMTPRQLGGGMAAGMQAFGQGAQEAQRERARMAQDAQRQKMLEQQMEMQQKRFGMDEQEFGLRRDELGLKRTQAQTAQEQAERVAAARVDFQRAYQQSGGKWSPQMSMMAMDAGIKGEDIERLAKGENLGRTPLAFHNGVGVEPFSGRPVAAVQDVNKPFFPSLVNGQVQASPNAAVQNHEVGKARAGASTITNNTAFPRAMAPVDAKFVESDMAKWESARAARASLRELATASPGAAQGPAANVAVKAIDFMSSLGIASPELEQLSANTAAFNSKATDLILANIKKLGVNPSNADLAQIKQLVPQITQSRVAREQLARLMLKTTNRAEFEARQRFTYIQTNQSSANWKPTKVNDMPANKQQLMPGAVYQHPITQEIAVYKGNGQFETVVGDD